MLIVLISLSRAAWFIAEIGLIFLGIFIIAMATPVIARLIDKLAAKNKTFRESAPPPERVCEDDDSENNVRDGEK